MPPSAAGARAILPATRSDGWNPTRSDEVQGGAAMSIVGVLFDGIAYGSRMFLNAIGLSIPLG